MTRLAIQCGLAAMLILAGSAAAAKAAEDTTQAAFDRQYDPRGDEDITVTRSITVWLGDLDLTAFAGKERARGRLSTASSRVCEEGLSRSITENQTFQQCRDLAFETALRSLRQMAARGGQHNQYAMNLVVSSD